MRQQKEFCALPHSEMDFVELKNIMAGSQTTVIPERTKVQAGPDRPFYSGENPNVTTL